MIFILVIVIIILLLAAIIAPIVYINYRNRVRAEKNIERGLKMVPLLIHLPPQSEDTEVAGRDVREIIEENISKAQIIYNIIASTLKKGTKVRLHGQRHFSFEVVGTSGVVQFYAIVPVSLVEVVKQAVVSAYPSARLEESQDQNIFSQEGKIGVVAGGELKLKESFAYPIATVQEVKRDAMQAILNALSGLEKTDGAAIQILMRPANPEWRKNALSVASSKRKGSSGGTPDIGQHIVDWVKDIVTAFIKPPEAREGKDKDKKELSSLDQVVIDSIEDKTRHSGYETLIRIVASSNSKQRSAGIVSNIVAAFSLFDAPGKNGFKYSPAEDIEEFVTSYILRFFPQDDVKTVLNSVELAALFHFPDQRNIPTSQLERQGSKQVDAPRNLPEEGLLLGYNLYRGVKKTVRLDVGDRQRHMYAVGQTGTGKSTFLENLALQDMLSGHGFAFIDPHGDVAERLLSMVPKHRTEDVIYFSPADVDYPLGLNLFEYQSADQKDFLIQEVLNMLYKLYDPQHQGIMGPRYEHLFRNAALTVMADPNGGTFIDIPKLFRDQQYVKQKLQHVKDQNVLEFWEKEMPQSQRSNDFGEVVSWFVSKFGAFLSNEMMRNIIGQTKSAFDLRDVMDNGKILLVNLSKGRLGELNSKLLGMIFVMKFQAAAMSRASIPEKERRDFALYVDEFQNFSTDSFATIMSEARKYHLNLIVANQFITQLTDEIRDAVFGNMGTIVAFRVGQQDVDILAKYFQPHFEANDLLRVPNHNTIVRTLVGGVPTQPFSMSTLPPMGDPHPKLAAALKQLSAAKYGRPKSVIEKEVFARLATQSDGPKPPVPGQSGPPQAGQRNIPSNAPSSRQQSNYSQGSFLDEWLRKKDKPVSMRPSPWAKKPPNSSPAVARPGSIPNSNQQLPPRQAFAPIGSTPAYPPSPQPTESVKRPYTEVSPGRNSSTTDSATVQAPVESNRDSHAPAPVSSNKQPTQHNDEPNKPQESAPNTPDNTSGEFHIRKSEPGAHHVISIDRDGTINRQE